MTIEISAPNKDAQEPIPHFVDPGTDLDRHLA